jgi:hypothetical protein
LDEEALDALGATEESVEAVDFGGFGAEDVS